MQTDTACHPTSGRTGRFLTCREPESRLCLALVRGGRRERAVRREPVERRAELRAAKRDLLGLAKRIADLEERLALCVGPDGGARRSPEALQARTPSQCGCGVRA